MRAADEVCGEFNSALPDTEPKYENIEDVRAAVKLFTEAISAAQGGLSVLIYPQDEQGRAVREVLVTGVGKNVTEITSASQQLETAIKTKDQKAYYTAADRFIAFQDAYPDKTGVLKAYGLVECDLAFGPPEK